MTQEEKAKAYDEAIERAREWSETKNGYYMPKELCEEIFPELRELGDERIRKTLMSYLRRQKECASQKTFLGIPIEQIIAWLEKQGEKFIPENIDEAALQYVDTCAVDGEVTHDNVTEPYWNNHSMMKAYKAGWLKQGEQKPTIDKVEPKFKPYDLVVDNCGYAWKIEGILNQFYLLEGVEGGESHPTIEWVNKTFHLWTIQDAKDGDVLQLGNVTAIFKEFIGNNNCTCYCSAYNGEFEIPSQDGGDNIYGCHNAIPTTKEKRDLLFKKMQEAGYEWDAEKKELKKIITPIFHIGDRVRYKGHECDGVITEITNTDYICRNAKLPISTQDKLELVEQKPTENRQEIKPNGGIVYEDFNDGDGYYKVNLAYLSKSQVEFIENLVSSWQTQDNNTSKWSEEDEIILNGCIHAFEKLSEEVSNEDPQIAKDLRFCYRKNINWLKSLRPQNHWKPSEERRIV